MTETTAPTTADTPDDAGQNQSGQSQSGQNQSGQNGDPPPYVHRSPGDLLTAQDWVRMQELIYDDIRSTSQQAADAVTDVDHADDADRLDGKDIDALTDEITRRVLDEVRGRSGYQQVFLVLEQGEFRVIEHNLGTAPLVDVYKLQYFEVVCREDDETHSAFATFYLHHSSEKRVRVTDPGNVRRTIDIQPREAPELGIPFAEMLTRYNVEYTPTSSLDDLETEFWKAFFRDPNDAFDDDQYCHSPWFERCCKQKTTVGELKDAGDWNDILFQMRPWKTVNLMSTRLGDDQTPEPPAPANVAVGHLDNNRTQLWMAGPSVHGGEDAGRIREYIGPDFDTETKVMVLLKV